MCIKRISYLLMLCIFYSNLLANVWHVSTDGSDETGTGSIDAPLASIQSGLDHANDNDTVLVSQGIYVENLVWREENGVKLIGENPANTIIDGNANGSVLSFDLFLTFNVGLNGSVENFTLRNGSAVQGAGISIIGGHNDYDHISPALSNLIITDNHASWGGGGIYVQYCDAHITNCVIEGNTAPLNNGGAAFLDEFDGIIDETTITSNSSGVKFSNSNWHTYPTINRTLISDNFGDGVNQESGNATYTNVTIANNQGFGIAISAGLTINMSNSIVWGNASFAQITLSSSTTSFSISYSDIDGGEGGIGNSANGTLNWLEGNISEDPLFDLESDDYILTELSPCIDAGDPSSPLDPDGTISDIGANYYHQDYSGPIWFVSTSGSNDTGDGSIALPYQTIQYAVSACSYQDTVMLLPGDYEIESPLVFPEFPIIIRSSEGFSNTSIIGSQFPVFLSNTSPIICQSTIQGITFEEFSHIVTNAQYLPRFSNCKFSNNQYASNGLFQLYESDSTAQFEYCIFALNTGVGIDPDGLFTGASFSTNFTNCSFSRNANGLFRIDYGSVTFNNSILSSSLGTINQTARQANYSYIDNPNEFSASSMFECIDGQTQGWPGFGDEEDGNLRLVPNSICIDRGNPSVYDPDGTRSDMGALYFNQINSYVGSRWHVAVDGDSWQGTGNEESPFSSIRVADNFASPGDTILIHDGSYLSRMVTQTDSVTFASLYLIDNDTSHISATIIDGELERQVVQIHHPGVNLVGLTIQNGSVQNYGGGIYIGNTADVSLLYLNILNNSAHDQGNMRGGGIASQNSPNLVVTNCLLQGNSADIGGAIYCGYAGSIVAEENIIRSNHSENFGGGLSLESVQGYFSHNTFIENTTNGEGQAIHLGENSNLDLVFNSIYSTSPSNSTISQNSGSNLNIENSILWGAPDFQVSVLSSAENCTTAISYSNSKDSLLGIDDPTGALNFTWGEGNINQNPQFSSLMSLELLHQSPCIDAGDPDYDGDGLYWAVDDNDQDPDGTRLDIGCRSVYQIDEEPDNNSLAFDGIDDYVIVPQEYSPVNIGQSRSIAAWVRPENLAFREQSSGESGQIAYAVAITQQITAGYSGAHWGGIGLELSENPKFQAIGYDGSVPYTAISGTTIPQIGRWYHLTLVFQDSELLLYVNGELEGIGNFAGFSPATIGGNAALVIGNHLSSQSFNYTFPGLVDDVHFWNRAISANEIRGLISSAPPISLNSNLLGNWSLDEGVGELIHDEAGSEYSTDGTKIGAVWSTLNPQTIERQTRYYVSVGGSDETGNGSQESPYARIQFGINSSQDGDTVLVEPGTYYENVDYSGKSVVLGSLYLTNQDTSFISQTVIDGNSNGRVVQFSNGESRDALLIGFTIQNGMTNDGSPGAGIFITSGSSPIISNNIIQNNSSVPMGNVESSGGGISVFSNSGGNPIINGNIIRNNHGFPSGGGVMVWHSGDTTSVIRNIIYDNTVDPCLECPPDVHQNHGGGARINNGTFANNTIWGNISEGALNDVSTTVLLSNNIMNYAYGSGEATFEYCLSPHELNGTSNLLASPQFLNESNNNYNLRWGSPAIDAGDPSSPLDPDGTRADIGAAYFNQTDTIPPEVHLNYPDITSPILTGDILNLTWEASDNWALDWTKLFFSADGESYSLSDSVDANLGSIQWVAADVISHDCKLAIWVSDIAGNIGADTLSWSFSIDDGTDPTISVITPSGQTSLQERDTLYVTWEAYDNVGIEWFDLFYYKNPSSPETSSFNIPASERSFSFEIPSPGVTDSAQIRVEVLDLASNTNYAYSDYFSVTDNTRPRISHFSIPDTIDWGIGSIVDIGVIATDNVEITGLDLNYSTDNGSNWLPIVDDLYPVQGRPTYSWLIPDIPGECQIMAVVSDAVGLTDTSYSEVFTIYVEYPRMVASLPAIRPDGDMHLRFSQRMDSLDIASGTQVIGSVHGAYEISGLLNGDDLIITATEGFVSLDTLQLVLTSSFWTNSFGYGLDGNGDGIYGGNSIDNDTSYTIVTAAGDYDQNGVLNFDDFDDFVIAWTNDISEYELAPHQGEIPFINIQPDSSFDIFDLATFASMWNWAAGISLSAPLTESYQYEEFISEQSGNALKVTLPLSDFVASQTIIKYDPTVVQISVTDDGLAKVSSSGLSMVDVNPDSGFILITSSHLSESNDNALNLGLIPDTKQRYTIEIAFQGSDMDANVVQKRSLVELLPIPNNFSLSQNYPNPFNASTTFEYGLPKNSDLSISIYDLRGRFVKEIYSGEQLAGYHLAQWRGVNDAGQNVASGLYFIVLHTPEYRVARKALILK